MNTKGNLLLVDDEPLILKMLTYSLSDYADNIYTAEDATAALKILNSTEIHCVLSDVNMPVMTGVDLLKKVRETNTELPFIFFTGHGNKELMLAAARLGAFDFLDKPFFEGIEEVVHRGLNLGLKKDTDDGEATFVSEYQNLLSQLSDS